MNAKVVDLPADLAGLLNSPQIETIDCHDVGAFPNSPLPLVIYRNAIMLQSDDPPSIFEHLFTANHWHNCWRNGIYPFHHYHSTAHEALGIASGSASVQLGGDWGIAKNVNAGDVIIIPAGVAHKNLGATLDFVVVGAYPHWQDWDMNYGRAGERPRADENIRHVILPDTDPIYGFDGPLLRLWKR